MTDSAATHNQNQEENKENKDKGKRLQILLAEGGKGGVGKTEVARLAVEKMLVTMGIDNVAIIDGDTTNPDIERAYRGLAIPNRGLNSAEGWDDLINNIDETEKMGIVINYPGGTIDILKAKLPELIECLKDEKIPFDLHLMWVLGAESDSSSLLQEIMGERVFAELASVSVVKNKFFVAAAGDRVFDHFNKNKDLQKLIKTKNVRVVELEKLKNESASEYKKALEVARVTKSGLGYQQALDDKVFTRLTHKNGMKVYLKSAFAILPDFS